MNPHRFFTRPPPDSLLRPPHSLPNVRMSQIISALTYALDLTEGQPMGHSVMTCLYGMKIAEELPLSPQELEDLYYGLLLKDAGCSSNSSRMFHMLGSDERNAKRDIKNSDWTKVSMETLRYLQRNVKPGRPVMERLVAVAKMAATRDSSSKALLELRCERGAYIVKKMGFSQRTADAVYSLDEHWNGKGYPQHLQREEIPLLSRVMNLAQTIEVYAMLHSPEAAIEMATARSGKWFDPGLVSIVESWGPDDRIWGPWNEDDARRRAHDLAPESEGLIVDEARLDAICEAFADVIDAKSPYTYHHSTGVTAAAVAICREMGLDAETEKSIRRAALLHDIGKLSVSNSILEKPGELNDAEWDVIRQHPYYTEQILAKAPIFERFSFIAGAHHEKLDGSGYHRALRAPDLPLSARILTVADIFDALSAERPYRGAMPKDKVFRIIGEDTPKKLDAHCYEALRAAHDRAAWTTSVEAIERLALGAAAGAHGVNVQ